MGMRSTAPIQGWTPLWARMSISPQAFSHADRTASPETTCNTFIVLCILQKRLGFCQFKQKNPIYLCWGVSVGQTLAGFVCFVRTSCSERALNEINFSLWSLPEKCSSWIFFLCLNPWQSLLKDFFSLSEDWRAGDRNWIPAVEAKLQQSSWLDASLRRMNEKDISLQMCERFGTYWWSRCSPRWWWRSGCSHGRWRCWALLSPLVSHLMQNN